MLIKHKHVVKTFVCALTDLLSYRAKQLKVFVSGISAVNIQLYTIIYNIQVYTIYFAV